MCGNIAPVANGCAATTHSQAERMCTTIGARLCTVSDMLNEESSSTGCGHDVRRLWTDEPCGENSFITMSDRVANAGIIPQQCTPANASAVYVRCCADTSPVFTSALSCAELGWALQVVDSPGGSTAVCGESEFRLTSDLKQDFGANTCFYERTHHDAAIICRAAGARLCVAHELQAGEAGATGCGHDSNYVWSATQCTLANGNNGYYVALGRPDGITQPRCQDPNNAVSIGTRCCADASPAALPLSPKTCAELELSAQHRLHVSSPTACGFSYLDCEPVAVAGAPYPMMPNPNERRNHAAASAYCATNGARLCSFPELLANEAAGTGCSYDIGLVWSSTACTTCNGSGFWAVAGEIGRRSEAPEVCLPADEDAAYVRCCGTVAGVCDRAGTGVNDCAALNRGPCEA